MSRPPRCSTTATSTPSPTTPTNRPSSDSAWTASASRERHADARDRLRASIDHGVASGPDDELVRLLFEFWPRSLRDPKAAVLDSSLQERQIAVYSGIFVLGETQGHFTLTDQPRLLAGNIVAMEDGYQMEILSGRRTRAEVKGCLHSYARAVTGCDIGSAA